MVIHTWIAHPSKLDIAWEKDLGLVKKKSSPPKDLWPGIFGWMLVLDLICWENDDFVFR